MLLLTQTMLPVALLSAQDSASEEGGIPASPLGRLDALVANARGATLLHAGAFGVAGAVLGVAGTTYAAWNVRTTPQRHQRSVEQ